MYNHVCTVHSRFDLQVKTYFRNNDITMVPTINIMNKTTLIENIFNQNRKLIAVNDWKNIARRAPEVRRSTLYCGKTSLRVHIVDFIFQLTQRATMYCKCIYDEDTGV